MRVPQCFDSSLYPHVELLSSKLVSPTTAMTVFALTVASTLCNGAGTLHGGAAATIFDLLTSISLAPLSRPSKFRNIGVSRTLNCTYLRPVTRGMRVRVECEVVSMGRNLCTVRGVMRKVKDDCDLADEHKVGTGEALVLCEHGKASIDPSTMARTRTKL